MTWSKQVLTDIRELIEKVETDLNNHPDAELDHFEPSEDLFVIGTKRIDKGIEICVDYCWRYEVGKYDIEPGKLLSVDEFKVALKNPTKVHTDVSTKPEPVKKPAKKKRGGNYQKQNKYGIPPELFHTDKQAYQRLWSRCKKGGIMYEEALKMGDSRRQKSTTKISTKSTKLVVTSPENPRNLPQFKLNDHVKQIKKYQDRQVSGVGVVTNFVNGLIEVNFKGTQYYKIAPDCLEVV